MVGKRTTLSDIAKKVGISKSAVSLAMNDSPMVSERTRKLVVETALSMGYVKNELVSSMMSNIKRSGGKKFSETIALVNGNRDEFALTNHPTLPRYCEGIREEASRLGYSINEFWLHRPNLTGESFSRTLRSRGIRGGIILGHSFGNVFPPSFKCVWKNFYFVSAGIKTHDPNLEMVSADHYAISYHAMLNALQKGYKRPVLIIDEHIDNLVDGRFVAGFLRAQMGIPSENIIPPLTESISEDNLKNLDDYLKKYNPDAILFLLDATRKVLQKSTVFKRRKIAMIQLERRNTNIDIPNWTGMEQNNDIVGKVAMRRLADMLSRTSSVVGENANILTLIPPRWVE